MGQVRSQDALIDEYLATTYTRRTEKELRTELRVWEKKQSMERKKFVIKTEVEGKSGTTFHVTRQDDDLYEISCPPDAVLVEGYNPGSLPHTEMRLKESQAAFKDAMFYLMQIDPEAVRKVQRKFPELISALEEK